MATDYSKAQDQYCNYRYCYDNGHDQWVQMAALCFRYWNSEQWDKLIKAQLDAEGRPALTFNIIESLIRALEGMQRALRNDARFTPTQDATIASAKVMDAIWLHTQQQNRFEFLETDVYKKGLIMGRAYFDVRVAFDDSHRGHTRIRSPRSQDVVLDPGADTYETDSWPQLFWRRWVSYHDIENLYGKEKAEAVGMNSPPKWYDYEDLFMSMQMGQLPYYRFEGMDDERLVRGHLLVERQYRVMKMKEHFVDLRTGDTSEIPESWDRNRISHVLQTTDGLGTLRKMASTIRWSVTCEGEVLHDEDSPYSRFTIIPYFPNFVDGISQGAVQNLIDPQNLFNKMTSQELHIINTTANSGLIVKRNNVKNLTVEQMEQWGSKSGVVFEVEDVEQIKKITPNQTPQGHDRLSFKADQIMRNIAGVSNQSRGFAREDVSGEAILANQAAADVNSAGWLANLHRTKQIVAEAVLDCAQAFYTDTRVIQINRGSIYKPEMEQITINGLTPEGEVINDVTRGRYSTTLVPSPARTVMSESDFKVLLELREKVGVAIPDALLLELSPASNKAQIIEALEGDSNERQRAAEEAEAMRVQLEAEKNMAAARKSEADAVLSQARAEKAAVEAQTDPDAAYVQVESARIEAEDRRHAEKLDLERRKVGLQEQNHSRQIALRLAEMDNDREIAAAAAKEKPASPRREKKPGSKNR